MDLANGFTSINPSPTASPRAAIAATDSSTAAANGTKRKRSPKTSMKFYAVRIGRAPGIYHTWSECLDKVRGYPKAYFKAFPTLTEAQAFLKDDDGTANGTHAGSGGKFYGVREGRVPGVYTTWPQVLEQITGWKGPKHKAFPTRIEAEMFVKEGKGQTQPPITMNTNGDADSGDVSEEPKSKKVKTAKKGTVKSDGASPASALEVGGEWEPGEAPLPPETEDGFDTSITLDQITGHARYKTADEFAKTKYHASVPAPEAAIRIWTDGSTLGNGRIESIGGVGVYFGPKDKRNISEPLSGSKQTNQRAELTAILRALEVAPRDRKVIILSDSNYAIKCVTEWFQKWRANNWQNSAHKPVENKDLIQKVVDMLDERMRLNKHRMAEEDEEAEGEQRGPWEKGPGGVKFTWVKGHANDEGNNAADELATGAARAARELAEDVVLD